MNDKALSNYTMENTISGGMAVTIFKNIKDDRFSVEEKLAAVEFVLSMPTYNSIYKDDFRDAVEWLYNEVVDSRLNSKTTLDVSLDLSGFPIGNF